MEREFKDPEMGSPTLSSSGTELSSLRKSFNTYSTLEVVRPSGLEAYKKASEAGYVPQWEDKSTLQHPASQTRNPPMMAYPGDPYPKAGRPGSEHSSTAPSTSPMDDSSPPPPPPPPPPAQSSQEMICGLPKRAFWIIFSVVSALCVIAIIVGGAVGGTRHQESQSSNDAVSNTTAIPTQFVTVTVATTLFTVASTSQPPTSTSQQPSSTTTAPETTKTVCVGGTGAGNYAGLCSFACNYGYCPPGPCTCTSSGAPVPTPPTSGVKGIPLKGEDDSYLGLCSFSCNHGYCPAGACTTKKDA